MLKYARLTALFLVLTNFAFGASSEAGAKFQQVVQNVYNILTSGIVAGLVSLVVFAIAIMLILKIVEPAKWWFISALCGIALIYGGVAIANALVG
jgi:hypothetical protein